MKDVELTRLTAYSDTKVLKKDTEGARHSIVHSFV